MMKNINPLRDYVKEYLFREKYLTPASAARFLRNIADAEDEQIEDLIRNRYAENSDQKDAYSRWGYALMEAVRPEQAMKLFTLDIEQDRRTWWAELCTAEYAASVGNIGLAQETVKRVYTENPSAKDGYGRVVWVLLKHRQVVSGYIHALLMKDVDADRVSPLFMPIVAGILTSSDMETSEKLITKAYAEVPSMKNGFARMASHFVMKKNHAEAVKWYEKDDALGKMTADVRVRYAPVLGWVGRVSDGCANIDRAYSEDKNLKDGYSQLADAVIYSGDYAQARDFLAKDYVQKRMTAANKLKYAEYLARFGELDSAVEAVESAYADDGKQRDKIVGLIAFVPFLKNGLDGLLQKETAAGRLTEAGFTRYLSVLKEKTEIYEKLIIFSKRCGVDVCGQWEKISGAVQRGTRGSAVFEIGKFKIEALSPKTTLTELNSALHYLFETKNAAPVIADCGCGCGVSLAVFLSLYPDTKIMAFEADRAKYELCLKNIQSNEMGGVELKHGFCSNADGESIVLISGDCGEFCAPSASVYHKHAGEVKRESVQTFRLSELVDKSLDYIKLTFCGTEIAVMADLLENGISVRGGCIGYSYDPEGMYSSLGGLLGLLEKNLYRYEILDGGQKGGLFWSKDIVFKCKEEKMFASSEPTEVRLINPEFRHYAQADEAVLKILGMTSDEWYELPLYIRAHCNEFYILMTKLPIKPKRILEWGTGLSTKIMSSFAEAWGIEYLLSIDDHAVYQTEALGYMNPVPEFLEACCLEQIGDLYPWNDKGYNYATYPLSKNMKFDLIFVDGRRRNECLLAASNCLADGGIVILHDSWRQRYHMGVGLFEKIDIFDDYTIMKSKKDK